MVLDNFLGLLDLSYHFSCSHKKIKTIFLTDQVCNVFILSKSKKIKEFMCEIRNSKKKIFFKKVHIFIFRSKFTIIYGLCLGCRKFRDNEIKLMNNKIIIYLH